MTTKKVEGTVVTSAPGSTRFEQARRRLAQETAREVEQVSDADVIAYLTPGATAATPPAG